MVLYRGVMTDVIARPYDDVATDPCERLDDIVLHDYRVRIGLEARPNSRARTDVAGKGITLRLRLLHLRLPQPVHLFVAHRNEHLMRFRWVALLDLGKIDNRKAEQMLRRTELLVHRESDDVSVGLLREIVVNHLGDLAHSKDHDITH